MLPTPTKIVISKSANNGPPTRNKDIGSGGEIRAPMNRAANQIKPLFSTIELLLIAPDLKSRIVTIGTWKTMIEEK